MNADIAYLDTSAAVKLLMTERESPALRRWLRPRPVRASASLLRVELLRIVRRAGLPGLIPEARKLLAGVHLIHLDDSLLDRAADPDPTHLRPRSASCPARGRHSRLVVGDVRQCVRGGCAGALIRSSPESKRICERQRVLVASVQCVRGSIDLEHRNGSRRRAVLGEIAAHEPADGHDAGNMVGKPAAEHLSEKAAVRNPGCGHVRGINAVLIPDEIDQGTNECNIIDSGLLRWSSAARYRPALPVSVRKENCEPMRIPDLGEMRDTAHLTAGHWPAVKRDDKRHRLEARSIRRQMEQIRPCDTAGIHGALDVGTARGSWRVWHRVRSRRRGRRRATCNHRYRDEGRKYSFRTTGFHTWHGPVLCAQRRIMRGFVGRLESARGLLLLHVSLKEALEAGGGRTDGRHPYPPPEHSAFRLTGMLNGVLRKGPGRPRI